MILENFKYGSIWHGTITDAKKLTKDFKLSSITTNPREPTQHMVKMMT